METIISIAALIIGFIISKILSSQKANLLSQELVSLKETNEQLNQKNKSLAESKEQLVIEKSKLEAHNANLQENLKNQKLDFEAMGEKFKYEFKSLAQSVLDEKSEKLTKMNEDKMSEIINPLKQQIGDFKQKVEETYDKESKERFSLGERVKELVSTTLQVSQEANNLTSALKGNVKSQGNWGEMILESILEHSGLTKNREYFLQEFIKDKAGNTIKDENGNALQPDVTIYYPDERKIIIDSKVSLIAWEKYSSAEDVEEKKKYLVEHIQSIKQHVIGLSKKNYPKYAKALDYVIMFIPIEPAFLEALKEDTGLWKMAYGKQIMLVSPTNLLAVLKIIADLWKVEQQNKNAIEIAEKAGNLYDKFCLFIDNMLTIGTKIDDAKSSYDVAFKQLSTGKGNIVSKVEELKKMGINAKKELPEIVLLDLKID